MADTNLLVAAVSFGKSLKSKRPDVMPGPPGQPGPGQMGQPSDQMPPRGRCLLLPSDLIARCVHVRAYCSKYLTWITFISGWMCQLNQYFEFIIFISRF